MSTFDIDYFFESLVRVCDEVGIVFNPKYFVIDASNAAYISLSKDNFFNGMIKDHFTNRVKHSIASTLDVFTDLVVSESTGR